MQGKKVMTVLQHNRKMGNQYVILNTANLSNGIYLVQVVAGTQQINIKMVVTH